MHAAQLDTFLARWAAEHPTVGAAMPTQHGQRMAACVVAAATRLPITRASRAGDWVELVTTELTLCVPAGWLQGSVLLGHDGTLKFPLGTLAVVNVAQPNADELRLLPVVVRPDGHVDTLGDVHMPPARLPSGSLLSRLWRKISKLLV